MELPQKCASCREIEDRMRYRERGGEKEQTPGPQLRIRFRQELLGETPKSPSLEGFVHGWRPIVAVSVESLQDLGDLR